MSLTETLTRDSAQSVDAARQRLNPANGRAVLTLDGHGQIQDCDPPGEALFKCGRSELVSRNIASLVPALAKTNLIINGQPNPSLRYYCRIGYQFEAVTQDGDRFNSELSLNLIDNHGDGRLTLIVRPTASADAA